MATFSAQNALNDANLLPSDIDLIIVATSSPDRPAPSTACIVQDKLKAYNAAAFDISAVCSGFLFAMSIACQFISSGTYENILVIGADTFSKITDWKFCKSKKQKLNFEKLQIGNPVNPKYKNSIFSKYRLEIR